MQTEWVLLSLLIPIGLIAIIASGIKKVAEGEEGLLIILGNYRRNLMPGTHFITPVVSTVVKINMLEQTMEIPSDKYISSNRKTLMISIFVRYKVFDSVKAYFEVQNYKEAIRILVKETLRAWVHDMTSKEILQKKHFMESKFKSNLNKEIKVFGIEIDEIMLGEIEKT